MNGFVQGFGIDAACGVATTVAHDCHHLLVTGTCTANTLVDAAGGVAVVRSGALTALVELPIGGLISDEPAGMIAGKSAGVMRRSPSAAVRSTTATRSSACWRWR